jgi:hypothetical protein
MGSISRADLQDFVLVRGVAGSQLSIPKPAYWRKILLFGVSMFVENPCLWRSWVLTALFTARWDLENGVLLASNCAGDSGFGVVVLADPI